MERLAIAALLVLIRVLSFLTLGQQRAVGRALGWLAWKLEVDAVRVTRINLARCFPDLSDEQRECLVRSSIQQTAQLLMEAGIIFHWPRDRWLPLAVRVEGESMITAALARGKGVLILMPHLGNWEYLSLYLGKYGVTALYDPPRLSMLDDPVRRARNREGANVMPIGQSGLRAVYRALLDRGVVELLPDQVPGREAGLHVEFFGQPALTMILVQRLIGRTHPVVLIGAALRVERGFELRFVEAEAAIHAADPAEAITAMNRSIERLVRAAPEQYQWEYKRFKRQPAGMSEWYTRGARARPFLGAAGKRP